MPPHPILHLPHKRRFQGPSTRRFSFPSLPLPYASLEPLGPMAEFKEKTWMDVHREGPQGEGSGVGGQPLRALKGIREAPPKYFLPRHSVRYTATKYGLIVVAGVGAGMVVEQWIRKKVAGTVLGTWQPCSCCAPSLWRPFLPPFLVPPLFPSFHPLQVPALSFRP